MLELLFAEPNTPFLGIAVLLAFSLIVGFGAIIAGWLFRPRSIADAKTEPYECGIIPVGDARDEIPVRYFTTAMLFLLFDAEAILLWPWAVALKNEGFFFAAEAIVFIAIVGFGYLHCLRRGAFEWKML